MIIPEICYRLTDSARQRYPIEFITRRGLQPGSAIAGQVIPLFEGFADRHLAISSLTFRVNITPNAVTESRLERVSVELIDVASGVLRSIMWEATVDAAAAGTGVVPDNSNAPIAMAAAGANASFGFNVPLVGSLVPAGCALRVLSSVVCGVPVLHGGTGHLVAIAIPMGDVTK